MAGERVRSLSGLNRVAWDLCELAVALSPADFNGNPTLSALQIALDATPGEVTEYELRRLLQRVCVIYGHFWLPLTAARRDPAGHG
jgi:hypothetical protein